MRGTLLALVALLSIPVHARGEDDAAWPRLVTFEDGVRLTLHPPQVDAWRDFKSLEARLAATLELPDREVLGTIRLRMATTVDVPRRVALVAEPEVVEISFPALDEAQLSRAREWVRRAVAVGAGEIQLADLIAAAQPGEAEVREVEVLNTPPKLLISHQPAILVVFDGAPVFQPIEGTELTLAMNSPSLLFRHSKTNWYYMLGWDTWLKTSDLEKGRWVAAGKLPSAFSKLPDEPLWRALKKMIPGRKLEAHDVPKVYVATEPTELIVTFGEATFQPVPGTALTYVDNTESDVFLNSKDGMYYALLSGRWFRTRGQGALEFCSQALPDDFAKIPPEHPAGRVLASVPGTDEAADALSAQRLPHEATVKRGSVPLEVSYDAMSHAKVRAHRGEAYRTWRGEAALPAARRKMPEPEPKKKPKPHREQRVPDASGKAATADRAFR